jgi:hypothetical protein
MTEFWYNLVTGQVEEGRVSPWDQVMGPYATRELAENALSRAQERTQTWDDDEDEWRRG